MTFRAFALAFPLAFAFMLAAAGNSTLGAQTSQTGVLQGRVVIADGRVIANATVALRKPDGSFPRNSQSDESGEFRVNFIPPGTYDVSVRLVGFQPATYEGIVIRAAEVQRITVTLLPSRTELQPVTVSIEGAGISLANTEYTSVISARERELLPAARDANALVNFTPGARPGQVFGGSTTQANLYQLDGVSVNQPGFGGSFLLPNVDWIEDFKVIGPGAGAEYGNFQGGLINIVTRSGSNTLQGQLRTFLENRAWNGSNANEPESVPQLDSRTEINADIRGPIIPDKLYFFVSGQEASTINRVIDARSSSSQRLSWLPTRTERREQKYYGKLTWQASDRDIVNASAGIDNVSRERVGLSGFVDAEATYQGSSPATFYQANWQRTLSNTRFLELKFSGYSARDNELPYNGSETPAVVLLDAPNTPQFLNASYARRNAPRSYGFSALHDSYFSAYGLQHNLKLGGDYVIGLWQEHRTRNGGLTWYTHAGEDFDAGNSSTWQTIPSIGVYATTDTGGRIDLNADTRNAAIYLQDYITVNERFSLNAGLRIGHWTGYITPGNSDGAQSKQFKAVSAIGLDPRIGAAFDISGDATLVAKAHWGRFHQNMFALFYDRAPGSNVFTNIEFCDWNDSDRTVLPDPRRRYTNAEFDQLFTCFPGSNLSNEAGAIEGYRQPYMDQIVLGIEKSIGANIRAEVVYINRRNRSVISLADNNLERNWSAVSNVRALDALGAVQDPDGQDVVLPLIYVRNDDLRARLAAGDAIPGYARADTSWLSFDPDIVIRPVKEAGRSFDQLQFVVKGNYPRFSFNAALAHTGLTGNLFSVNGYFNPDGQENGPFVERNGQINYHGNLQNFSPWDFKLRISGQLPWRLEGGAFVSWTSGDYWTPTLNISRDIVFETESSTGERVTLSNELFRGAAGQRIFTEPRGNRQLPGQTNLDVRLQRVVSIGRNDLIIGLEAFNLMNGSAERSLKESLNNQDSNEPASMVGAVRLRQLPMSLRLNVQYRL